MAIDKKASKLLLISAVSFVVFFSVIIISVNNWLKQALKEETLPVQPVPANESDKPKYRQAPIGVVSEQMPLSGTTAGVKKSIIPEKTAGSGKNESKESIEEPVMPAGVLAN